MTDEASDLRRPKRPPPSPALLDHQRLALRVLAERACGYAEAASSANTCKAYAADWKHFAGWCRREGLDALAPDPQVVGRYITARASGEKSAGGRKNAFSSIERRLAAFLWGSARRLAGAPPRQDRLVRN